MPRLIPGLEPILLHSEGPLHIHKKSSGKEVFYRDKKQDKEVKLYWSVPPQRFDQLSADTESLFKIDEEYRDEVKYIVSQLQRLEWLIRNASLPEKYKEYQNDLIQRIVSCYKAFAIIEPKNDSKISGWQGSILGFFLYREARKRKSYKIKFIRQKCF